VNFAAGRVLFTANSKFAGFVSGRWPMKAKYRVLKRRVGKVNSELVLMVLEPSA
jgi:hypothetical protein